MDDINPEFERARRRPRRRRERRHEPGGAPARLAGLRHADPRRRPREVDHRDQALDGQRLRRHRQRALHEPEDRDALRRREGRPGRRSSRRSRRCSGTRRPAIAEAGGEGTMQKILNDPERVRRRDARGHPRRPPGRAAAAGDPRAIVRADAPVAGKVGDRHGRRLRPPAGVHGLRRARAARRRGDRRRLRLASRGADARGHRGDLGGAACSTCTATTAAT